MGGLFSALCVSAKQVASIAVPDLSSGNDDAPDVKDDDRSTSTAREYVRKFSAMCSPVNVQRLSELNVNHMSADRLSEQKSLPRNFSRRLSRTISFTPPIEGAAQSINDIWTPGRKELEVAIHKEKVKDHEDPHPALLSEEDRLRRRLGKLKMDVNVVRGDGNCLFRAISYELWATEDYHMSVRRKAVRHMREHKEDFEGYLGEEFTGYCANMERSGVWGDELSLRAVCDAYGVVVNVVTSDQLNWFMRYLPATILHAKELFLTYISPVHYNTIRRKEALRSLKPALSLTRRSVIQAAIDKAAQAQLEMQGIPEAPSVRARHAGDSASKPLEPASPFTPAGQKLPSIPSASFHTASSGGSDGNGAEPEQAPQQQAGAGPSSSSALVASHAAGGPPDQALTADAQRRLRAEALQAHATSLKARDSASSFGSQQSMSRSHLGSLAECATEGPGDGVSSSGVGKAGAESGSESPFAARSAQAQPGPPGILLPGQVQTRPLGGIPEAMRSPFAGAAEGSSTEQASGVSVRERGKVSESLPVVSEAAQPSGSAESRTQVTAVVQAPASVNAVLAGKSQATNPAALRELLELDSI